MFNSLYEKVRIKKIQGSLEEAKEVALDEATYTQADIAILDSDDTELTRSSWIPHEPTDEDECILKFEGEEGYYSNWSDETY